MKKDNQIYCSECGKLMDMNAPNCSNCGFEQIGSQKISEILPNDNLTENVKTPETKKNEGLESTNLLIILNNLNTSIGQIGSHILMLFKFAILSIVVVVLASLFIMNNATGVGMFLLVINFLISIIAISQLYQLAKNLKENESYNDSKLLEYFESAPKPPK